MSCILYLYWQYNAEILMALELFPLFEVPAFIKQSNTCTHVKWISKSD